MYYLQGAQIVSATWSNESSSYLMLHDRLRFLCRSDLLILDFEQRKSHLKKLGQKLEEMKNKHHLLLLEQVRSKSNTDFAVTGLLA